MVHYHGLLTTENYFLVKMVHRLINFSELKLTSDQFYLLYQLGFVRASEQVHFIRNFNVFLDEMNYIKLK